MDAKVPMFEFAIDRRLAGFDLATVEGQVGALRAAAPIVAEIRDRLLRPGYERVLARRLGMDPTEVRAEVERAARGASHAPARREPVEAGPANSETATVAPVTLLSLPRTADVALERGALMGALQYGHQVDQATLARAFEVSFRHPALEAIRQVIVAVPDRTRAGWAMDAVNAVREPYRSLAGELLMSPFPARDEDGAARSTADLCRRLILRNLDREKNELLGAVQRVPADSDGGRALRMRLRDLDIERQRFTES
jgi:DNA primase